MPDKPRSASELVEQKLQALGKGTRPATPATADGAMEAPAEMPAPAMASGNELDMLRSIMFGSMQRDIDRRMREMNESLEAVTETLTERTEQLGRDMDSRVSSTQRESGERLERQAADLATAQKELGERLEQQLSELRASIKTLSDEMRQRNDALRTEIMGLLKALEDSKTSRHAMGDMLVEMGQRLRGDQSKR